MSSTLASLHRKLTNFSGFRRTLLSERVGITMANISILKNGKARAIRFDTLDKICEVLDCQPGDIIEYEKEVNDEKKDFTDTTGK